MGSPGTQGATGVLVGLAPTCGSSWSLTPPLVGDVFLEPPCDMVPFYSNTHDCCQRLSSIPNGDCKTIWPNYNSTQGLEPNICTAKFDTPSRI